MKKIISFLSKCFYLAFLLLALVPGIYFLVETVFFIVDKILPLVFHNMPNNLTHSFIKSWPYIFNAGFQHPYGFPVFVLGTTFLASLASDGLNSSKVNFKLIFMSFLGAFLIYCALNKDFFELVFDILVAIYSVVIFCLLLSNSSSSNCDNSSLSASNSGNTLSTKITPPASNKKMIGSAIQNGNTISVYNEFGSLLFSKQGELVGYTSTTVSVKTGMTVTVYNENGSCMYSRFSG